MLISKTRTLAFLAVAAVAATFGQGSCTTTPWHTWHYPYAGQNGTADATLYEHDITVIPPNPPLTTEYETVHNWVALDTEEMNVQMFEPYPGYTTYLGHDIEFSPDLPGASALTIGRYTHATSIKMVSAGQNGVGVYETEDTNKPADWDWCGPAFP